MRNRDMVIERSIFPAVAGILVGAGVLLGVGVGLAMAFHNPPPPAATPPASAATAGTDDAKAAPDGEAKPAVDETKSSSTELKSLDSAIALLSDRVNKLQEKVDAMPKGEGPDLKPLETKVDELAKSTEGVGELPGKLSALGERVGGFDKSLESLRNEVASLREQASKGPAATSDTPKTAAEDVNVSDEALAPGVELYKQGKYAQALDVFRKLTDSSPNDARVWYYAALANGAATRQWTGETERLVNKGIERERAGTPDSSKIDAAFAGLSPAGTKNWLAAYRKRASSR